MRAKKGPIFIISNILTKKGQVHQNRRSAKDQRTVRARREKKKTQSFPEKLFVETFSPAVGFYFELTKTRYNKAFQ